jgi:hypothetical protein
MSNPKLLFANIKIPIQVFDDGSFHSFENNIDIEFTNCDSLPEPNNNDNSYFMSRLMNFTGQKKQDQGEIISVEIHEPELSNIEENHESEEEESESDSHDEDPEPESKIMVFKEDIKTVHARPVNSSFKKRQFKHNHTAKRNTVKA